MRIREATDDDQDRVVHMRLAFLADDSGLDVVSEALAADTHRFVLAEHEAGRLRSWFAEEDGACVGVVSLVLHAVPPNPRAASAVEGFVINMYVVPEHRGRGVGRALLDALETAGRDAGLRRLTLHATDAGRRLYEAAGFTTDDTWMKRFLG